MITMAIIQLLMLKEKELEGLEELRYQLKNCIIRGLRIRANPEVFHQEGVERKLLTFSLNGQGIVRIVELSHQLLSTLEHCVRKVQ